MKKHINPYLLVFILILILSAGTFYMTKKYNLVSKTGTASILSNQLSQTIVGSATDIHSTNIELMHGTCVVIATDRNGNVLPYPYSYSGQFNASYDCVPDAVKPLQNTALNLVSTGQITVQSPVMYFANDAMVSLLEARLITLGVLNQAGPTGTYSIATFNAIKTLQSKNGIPVTGFLDNATLAILNKVTLQKGSTPGKNYLQIATPTSSTKK